METRSRVTADSTAGCGQCQNDEFQKAFGEKEERVPWS